MRSRLTLTSLLAVLAAPRWATAQAPQPAAASSPIASAAEGVTRSGTRANVVLSGYVEAFYQWNTNDPDNRITNFRGFDNRHNSFTLSNVALDALGAAGPVSTRLAVQYGHTPETYYLAAPTSQGSGPTMLTACPSISSRKFWRR